MANRKSLQKYTARSKRSAKPQRSIGKLTLSLESDSTPDDSQSLPHGAPQDDSQHGASTQLWRMRDSIVSSQEFPSAQRDPNAIIIPPTSEYDEDEDDDYNTGIEDPEDEDDSSEEDESEGEEVSEDEEAGGDSVAREDEAAPVRPRKRTRTEFEQGEVSRICRFLSVDIS